MRLSELKIDPDFRDCLPRLTDEEYGQLEENILEYGIQSPLIIWHGYIVDGHNRYSIAFTNNIVDVPVREEYFESKDDALQWILENQLGRRNLSDFSRNEIALRYKEVIARRAKERQQLSEGRGVKKVCPNDQTLKDEPINTREEIAKIAGTNGSSVKRTEFILKNGTEDEIERARRGGKGNSQGALVGEIKKRIAPAGMKFCSRCEELKPEMEFYVDSKYSDGLDCVCKDCRKERAKESKKRYSEDTTDTAEIVAEMYSDETKPYTSEMLVEEVTANSDNYISLLRNMIEDRTELLDAKTKHELRVTVDNIVAAIIQIQEELL